MASDVELAAMRHAITLSALGLGTTSPNPPVGCVILDNQGTVAGAGFHRRKGEAHAEVHALAAAGPAARGGTAVVTLEPCNHVGVTPACRQALLDAGIVRVVIGVIDPTSRGEGGAAVLAAAGVEVETDVIHDEVLTVLRPWLTATLRQRPYLTWAYSQGDEQHPAMERHLISDLRGTADIVLANNIIDEGIVGGHASEHFALPEGICEDVPRWLPAAYAYGARTVLAVGLEHAETLRQNIRHVDEVVVAVPRASPSQALTVLDQEVTPANFVLVDVAARHGSLLVRFRQNPIREV